MKALALILLLLSPFVVCGQTSNPNSQSVDPALLNSLEAQRNNIGLQLEVQFADASPALREAQGQYEKFIELYKQKRFDEAFPISQKLVATMLTELGEESLETARAYRNLGYLQFARNKRKEAVAALEAAAAIYDKNTDLDEADALIFARVLESLGAFQYTSEKYEKSGKTYERAVALREKLNGADAAETISSLWILANIKRALSDFRAAAPLYRSVLANRYKNLGAENVETLDAFERCHCTFLKMGKKNEAESLKRDFPLTSAHLESGAKNQNGFVRAQAIKIESAQPPEVSNANARPKGRVNVRVLINENGKVLHACGAASNTDLRISTAAEQAAYQSKFKPATLNGATIKSVETLIYDF